MSLRKRGFLAYALVACVLIPPLAIAQDPRASVVASVAREWLQLVDRGDTAAAYTAAGAKFRGTITSDAWAKALLSQREPRGKLQQRALSQTAFEKRLGDLPEGEYALLLFRTAFEKQPDASETLTLEREKDGWRVIGYLIR